MVGIYLSVALYDDDNPCLCASRWGVEAVALEEAEVLMMGAIQAVNITAKTMVTVLAVYFISPSYCYLLAEAILFIAVKYSRKADRAKSC